jgi:hypothetical protein
MSRSIVHDIQAKHIDSVQKLHILLFFSQRPGFRGTLQEIETQLYWGNDPFIEKTLVDLQQAGLLSCSAKDYGLSDQPEVISLLQRLADAFKSPLTRQEILRQIGNHDSHNFH